MNGRNAMVASSWSSSSGRPWPPRSRRRNKPSRLTVERIFQAHEFEAEGASVRWLPEGRELHDLGGLEGDARRARPRPARPGRRARARSSCRPRT